MDLVVPGDLGTDWAGTADVFGATARLRAVAAPALPRLVSTAERADWPVAADFAAVLRAPAWLVAVFALGAVFDAPVRLGAPRLGADWPAALLATAFRVAGLPAVDVLATGFWVPG
jgi:hypothetical protein